MALSVLRPEIGSDGPYASQLIWHIELKGPIRDWLPAIVLDIETSRESTRPLVFNREIPDQAIDLTFVRYTIVFGVVRLAI